MSKILIISAVFPPEPVVSANLSYDIACLLSEMNSVSVISPKPSRPFGFQFIGKSMDSNFKHIQADSFVYPSSGIAGRFKESYSFGKYCYNYIANNHPDIDAIYVNTWPLLGQYFAVRAARKFKIPIVVHVQDIYPESLSKKVPLASSFVNGILKPLDKYILGKAAKVIAISQKMKDYLVKSRKLDNSKIIVVPNWQDEETFLSEINATGSTSKGLFTFMYLGNIGPVAGVELLSNAFEKAKLRNARLVIAGAGTMKESLIKEAAKFPDCNIEFWPVPEGMVAAVQNLAEVLLLPVKKGNASYSIPSKLPAYMFSAKPIIACVDADSDTAATINESNCGYVVEPENVESLVQAMKEVYQLEKRALEKLGINGREYALLNLSKKRNLQKVISVIENSVSWK